MGFTTRIGPFPLLTWNQFFWVAAVRFSEFGPGPVQLNVASPDGGLTPPGAAQAAAYRHAQDHQSEIRSAINASVPQHEQLTLSFVHVLPIGKDDLAFVGYEFESPSNDAGVGVMTHSSTVLKVGHGLVAIGGGDGPPPV